MSTLPAGTSAAARPPIAAPFATPTLRRWLDEAFGEFYNALFDAACATESATAHDPVRALLRQCRAHQLQIVDGACADIALLLADAGGGVVVPISAAAGGDPQRHRSWQRRLTDAFMRRCVRLELDAEHLALLERVFHRCVIAPIEQLSAGGASERQPAVERVAAEHELHGAEHIERLVSRFRAGGLKLMNGEAIDAPQGVAPLHQQAPAVMQQDLPAPQAAHGPRYPGMLLLTLAAAVSVALASAGWLRGVQFTAAMQDPPVPQAASLPVPVPTFDPVPAPVEQAGPVAVEQTPVVAALPAAVEVASAVAIDEPAPAESIAPGPVEAVAPPVAGLASPSDARLAEQTSFLMHRGAAALAELRLTEPFPDSAVANYLAVLAIDPAHAAARQGLERVVARYAELVRDARQRGDFEQAERLRARARSVLPQAPLLRELEVAGAP